MGIKKTKPPSGATTITPKQQLWKEISDKVKPQIEFYLSKLNDTEQDDVCTHLIDNLRYGSYHEYSDSRLVEAFENSMFALDMEEYAKSRMHLSKVTSYSLRWSC